MKPVVIKNSKSTESNAFFARLFASFVFGMFIYFNFIKGDSGFALSFFGFTFNLLILSIILAALASALYMKSVTFTLTEDTYTVTGELGSFSSKQEVNFEEVTSYRFTSIHKSGHSWMTFEREGKKDILIVIPKEELEEALLQILEERGIKKFY